MPIEIKELIIRMNITTESNVTKTLADTLRSHNEKEIIDRCVEKVLRKLNKKTER